MSQQWNPLQDLMVLQDRMNRLFEDATQRRSQPDDEFERADWTPASDIEERESGYVIALDLPGIDRNAWAVAEANWTYQQLGLRGRARTGDALRGLPIARPTDHQIPRSAHPQILLAYTVNELSEAARAGLLDKLVDTTRTGTGLLIVEPIAKRDKTWWPEWTARLGAEGARADEWRFPASLPASLRQIARSAGLDPRELTARSISTI